MQIAATWCERAGFAHSRATCQRTQIYGEYTGGTIIIRLMHSSRGAHNLKLVAQVAILHCESSSLYRRNSVILCVHSSFSFFLSVCVCFIYRERWARFFQFDWQSYGSIVERMTKRFFTLVEDLLIFFFSMRTRWIRSERRSKEYEGGMIDFDLSRSRAKINELYCNIYSFVV